MYTLHRMLQQEYYRQCKADLFRVVFYERSAMCTHTAQILQVMEIAHQQVVKHLATTVLDALNLLGTGAAARPGGAMGAVAEVVATVWAGVMGGGGGGGGA